MDTLNLNEAVLPTLSDGTYQGVEQLFPFDPYRPVSGATLASLAGADTRLIHEEDKQAGSGDMMAVSASAGGWIGVAGVDFSANGATGVLLTYTAPEGAAVEILLDSPDAKPAAAITLPAISEAAAAQFDLPETITGIHDLYFRFSKAGIALLQWQFTFR